MIIDMHHHLSKNPDDWAKLSDECARLGIRKVVVFGYNEDTPKAMAKYPELIVGFGTFTLGVDSPGKIDDFVRMGFKGVKFTRPRKNYDDREFYPVYARLAIFNLIALFHLGIVARGKNEHLLDTDCNRMRPIYMDTIARAFPELTVIGAHLGNPWHDEAAMAARWNPNLYFDLSGSTLKAKPARFIGEVLWWKGDSIYSPDKKDAWEKIVFGSDVAIPLISDVLSDYRRVFAELGVPQDVQQKVLYGTMARLLGLEGT